MTGDTGRKEVECSGLDELFRSLWAGNNNGRSLRRRGEVAGGAWCVFRWTNSNNRDTINLENICAQNTRFSNTGLVTDCALRFYLYAEEKCCERHDNGQYQQAALEFLLRTLQTEN